jgi:hypothetical protein
MKNVYPLHTLPGVARQPPTFFGSPKKVGKENDRTSAAPSGCPFMQVKKWEIPTTRFASEAQTRVFLYPFFAPHKRQLPSGNAKNNPA